MNRLVLLLCLLQHVTATNRVVVTFDTWAQAAMPYDIHNATIIKQYGRRMVIDLGREAELPEAWLGGVFKTNVTIELDDFVKISWSSINWEEISDNESLYEPSDDEQSTYDMPEATAALVEAQQVSGSTTSNIPWNLADSEPYSIHVEGTWRLTNSTPDVFVAVLDTGLADLAKGSFLHLESGYDFISDLSISLDGDGRDSDSTDPGDQGPNCLASSWHGTMVTSILAADHGNPFGVLGVAQNASIIPIRVLGQCSSGYANDITDAIVWAAGGTINGVPDIPNPAKIISMSFAGSGACPSYLQSAVNHAAGLGALLLAAAGNQGLETIENTFPANCNNVMSVGASRRSGNLTLYSNKGAHINAPGGDGANLIHVLSVQNDNLIDFYSIGTSMAVPHVAGVAALRVLRDLNFSWPTFLKRHVSGNALFAQVVCGGGYYLWGGSTCLECSNICFPGKYKTAECSSAANTVCVRCPANTYSYQGANAVSDCYCNQGYYGQGLTCTACPEHSLNMEGFTEVSSCVCDWNYYRTNDLCYLCTSTCTIGQYRTRACTGFGDITCQGCPSNSYSNAGSTSISQCICNPGFYGTGGSCTVCPLNSNSIAGTTVLANCFCNPQFYKSAGTCIAMGTTCIGGTYQPSTVEYCGPCGVGTYSFNGASSCTGCGSGKFSTISGSTTCTVCSVCDNNIASACIATRDITCCNKIHDPGFYATSCLTSSTCPAINNGYFTHSNTEKLNRCMDFSCNEGYFAPPAEIAKAAIMCQTSNYVLDISCASFLGNVCVSVTKCVQGLNTLLQTPSGTSISNPTTNDIQCTPCQPCMPGTIQISACTELLQTVCAVCATSGLYTAFAWNGKCMYYSDTPGAMTLSQTPIGYFPHMLSYSDAVARTYVDNSIAFPTKKVVAFTSDSITTQDIGFGSPFSMNMFIPCASPPFDRRVKLWTSFQAAGVPVQCTSVTNCANFQAQCNSDSSTECSGWNPDMMQGFYAQ
jgi:hypothetical protein